MVLISLALKTATSTSKQGLFLHVYISQSCQNDAQSVPLSFNIVITFRNKDIFLTHSHSLNSI